MINVDHTLNNIWYKQENIAWRLLTLKLEQSRFVSYSDMQFTVVTPLCDLSADSLLSPRRENRSYFCFAHFHLIWVTVLKKETKESHITQQPASSGWKSSLISSIMEKKELVWPMKLGKHFHNTPSSWSWHLGVIGGLYCQQVVDILAQTLDKHSSLLHPGYQKAYFRFFKLICCRNAFRISQAMQTWMVGVRGYFHKEQELRV